VPAATRVGLLGGAGRPFGCRRGIESEGPLLDAGGRLIVAGNDGAHRFDHVVSVMFENRSFDNLLGYLYDPGEVASFEGVAASCPTPSRATPRTPSVGWCRCTWRPRWTRPTPFNAPDDPGREPTMDGFVLDYVNTFRSETGRLPGYDEYAQIMSCYTPQQVPVISTIARGFATFDHWFCEVPSQTFTNRSFYHAATASGLVVNPPTTASRSTTRPRRSSSGWMPPGAPGGCTSTPACRSRSPG
jgi:phospholipase C